VAERVEEPEAEARDGLEPASPAAVSIALGRATRKGGSGALDAEAEAFLRKQSNLIDLQTEHLHEQRDLIISRLRWGRFSDRLKALLQALTVLVGVSVAGAVALMAWQAHEDHGLSIAPFSVPPELAARGLTGQVVAAKVLDRLSEMQDQTLSGRPASTYDENWGDDIKVEIPETGVSLGELNRWLREWLGHETRITGEVVRTATGVTVTARAGGTSGRTFPGAEVDMDALIGRAAEAVYANTQPYRYAVYLGSHGHDDEALQRFAWLAHNGSPEDQAWAYGGWSSILLKRGDAEGIVRVLREGQRRGLPLYDSGALNTLGVALNQLYQYEAMLAVSRQVLDEVRRSGRGFGGLTREEAELNMQAVIASHYGDRAVGFGGAVRRDLDVEGAESGVAVKPLLAAQLMRQHDVRGGLGMMQQSAGAPGFLPQPLKMLAAYTLDDWAGVVAVGEPQLAAELADPVRSQLAVRRIGPFLAIAYARLGRLADARVLAARLPADCDDCLWAKGDVAAIAGDQAGADTWFAQAVRNAPSIPMPETRWGAVLLERGDLDGAIARLKAASAKGPHYADPRELWGEALLRKGEYVGAAAKFAEADRSTPRWGRNHLMWGQALMLSGRYREARAQFEAANALDLSRPDRAALDVLLARTASGRLHG
jgi:tetratricopeptide (TPR) repeat protein